MVVAGGAGTVIIMKVVTAFKISSHRFRHFFNRVQRRITKRVLCNLIINTGAIESSMVGALTGNKDQSHPGDASKQRENFV